MSKQILVKIDLPAAGKMYEVFIPDDIHFSVIANQLADMLSDLSEGMYLPSDPIVLINTSSGATININATAEEQNIKYGSRLLLI